jgi:hypothetical protein
LSSAPSQPRSRHEAHHGADANRNAPQARQPNGLALEKISEYMGGLMFVAHSPGECGYRIRNRMHPIVAKI